MKQRAVSSAKPAAEERLEKQSQFVIIVNAEQSSVKETNVFNVCSPISGGSTANTSHRLLCCKYCMNTIVKEL